MVDALTSSTVIGLSVSAASSASRPIARGSGSPSSAESAVITATWTACSSAANPSAIETAICAAEVAAGPGDDLYLARATLERGLAEPLRDDECGVSGVDVLASEGVRAVLHTLLGLLHCLDVGDRRYPLVLEPAERVAEGIGDLSAVEIDHDVLGVEHRVLDGSEDEAEDDRQAERRDDAEDERRLVAHPLAQVLARYEKGSSHVLMLLVPQRSAGQVQEHGFEVGLVDVGAA